MPLLNSEEHAVVVRAARQPAHQPAAPLRPAQLRFARHGILVASVPHRSIDRLHAARAHRVAPARLMRRDQHLGAEQRGGPRVLDDVVVVADEDPDAAAVRRVEHGVAVAGGDVRMLEDVQLAVHRPAPVGHGEHVAVVDAPVVAALDEAGADAELVLARQPQQLLRARPVGHGLGQQLERLARELAHVPVAREAHLGTGEDLGARMLGLHREVAHAAEVVGFVAGCVLELDGGDADVAHAALSSPDSSDPSAA